MKRERRTKLTRTERKEGRRRELDAERYRWHADQAERLKRAMTDLVVLHERQARKLLEGEASRTRSKSGSSPG